MGLVKSGRFEQSSGPGSEQLTRLVRGWATASLTTCFCEIYLILTQLGWAFHFGAGFLFFLGHLEKC